MKNYNEMVNCLLERREQYQKEQRAKRKKIVSAALPAFGICLALFGIGIFQGGISLPETREPLPQNTLDTILSLTEESLSETKDVAEFVGMVQIEGVSYVQCSSIHEVYTPDEYLGDAEDFNGTYQLENSGDLYTVKEDVDVLMVKFDDGEIAILVKEVK